MCHSKSKVFHGGVVALVEGNNFASERSAASLANDLVKTCQNWAQNFWNEKNTENFFSPIELKILVQHT